VIIRGIDILDEIEIKGQIKVIHSIHSITLQKDESRPHNFEHFTIGAEPVDPIPGRISVTFQTIEIRGDFDHMEITQIGVADMEITQIQIFDLVIPESKNQI
jgi:hypothetical protein